MAFEGIYIPAIATAQENLPESGLLYLGDSMMEALATRAYIAQSGDYYLMPLTPSQTLSDTITQILADKVELELVYETDGVATDQAKLLAQGQETQ